MSEVIIVGSKDHAKVVRHVVEKCGWEVHGYIDLQRNEKTNMRYLGTDNDAMKLLEDCPNVIIGICSTGDNDLRNALYNRYKKAGFTFQTFVSPDAIVAKDVVLGEGSIVMDGCVIHPGSVIGKNCVINTRTSVDHDCLIGDNSVISPGTTVCGGVETGGNCFIGAGTTILQQLTIEDNVVIAAGSLVVKDCDADSKYLGVPAKKVIL